MLKTQIYLEITENMIIFDVGELQNLKFTTSRGDKAWKSVLLIWTTRSIAKIILLNLHDEEWPRGDSNPHAPYGTTDFKSVASTNSATRP